MEPGNQALYPKLDAELDEGLANPQASMLLRVCALLAERFNLPIGTLRPDSNLLLDLKLDPIDVADLPLALEEAFEIDISNADAERIATVEDAVRCVAFSRDNRR